MCVCMRSGQRQKQYAASQILIDAFEIAEEVVFILEEVAASLLT